MSKRIAIMQPYLFPYIGYFQLLNAVDEFVIYDNIKYTKKGWINRNRILVNKKDQLLTVNLKKGSDYLNVVDREISDSWDRDRKKMLNVIHSSYSKAPQFVKTFDLIQKILFNEDTNLFRFILNSINLINDFLDIQTSIIISSTVDIDHELKSQDKVLAICKARNADVYINSIGGIELYSKEVFKENKIKLNFIKSNTIVYDQFDNEFIPWLSIIDILMFNTKEKIQTYLTNYKLV